MVVKINIDPFVAECSLSLCVCVPFIFFLAEGTHLFYVHSSAAVSIPYC